MDLSRLRKITNATEDIRLISLRALPVAAEFPNRDTGGPYLLAQGGYDPQDATVTYGEFLLSRSGAWLLTSWFFRLPAEQRRAEFFFSTAAEAMELLRQLPSDPVVLRPRAHEPEAAPAEDAAELRKAISAAEEGSQP